MKVGGGGGWLGNASLDHISISGLANNYCTASFVFLNNNERLMNAAGKEIKEKKKIISLFQEHLIFFSQVVRR